MRSSLSSSSYLLCLLFILSSLSPSFSQQPCKFSCEGDKVAVQAARLPYSNGCSVPSFVQLPDFSFEKCCDAHDACYMTCGVSKEACEKDFQTCLSAHCADSFAGGGGRKRECDETANTFVTGVRIFGCPAFVESQRTSCECVDEEEVEAKTTEALTKFYGRFNAEKVADVATTVEKNKGKKTPSMWRALYKKYPQAISIISRDGESQTESGLGEEL